MSNAYQWIPFYEAFADKLLEFSDKRDELFELISRLSSEQPLMQYLHFERDGWWEYGHIDPFTVFGIINRMTTDVNRTMLAKIFAGAFGIQIPAPTQFTGIPVLNPMNSFFVRSGKSNVNSIDEVWNLFILAMKAAETGDFSDAFMDALEKVIAIEGLGLYFTTLGLYWIRPNFFMPLDKNSRQFIIKSYGIDIPGGKCRGEEYVKFLETLKKELTKQPNNNSFPELSHAAWQKTDPPSPEHDNIPEQNIILYGTPGTGKTYSSALYAVSIIEEKSIETINAEVKAKGYSGVYDRYKKHKDDGLIAFTTFHQSFGYEEFIEGIRPVVTSSDDSDESGDIKYEVRSGIFKEFCDKAGTPFSSSGNMDFEIGKNPTVWKVSLEGAGNNPTKTECFENDHIRIGWEAYGENIPDNTKKEEYIFGGRDVLNAFYNRMQIGDIFLVLYSRRTVDAIGVITSEPEWHDEYPNNKRLRKVKWLVKGINEDIVDLNAGKAMTLPTVYKLSVSVSDAIQIVKNTNPQLFTSTVKIPNRVFIIDEINRGNISKIFGELITLIEPSKRIGADEELRSILPYSGQKFGVPSNVHIIGTMNTADRSIAMMDTALRRRFSFVEIRPDSSLLSDVLVAGIDISDMLDTLNKRITVLLDREHTIGHSYLLPLKDAPTIENLAGIFENKIIPLLQEYFHDDYEKIRLVLGDNQKTDAKTCFIVKKTDVMKLFRSADIDVPEYYYEINSEAFMRIDAYAYL